MHLLFRHYHLITLTKIFTLFTFIYTLFAFIFFLVFFLLVHLSGQVECLLLGVCYLLLVSELLFLISHNILQLQLVIWIFLFQIIFSTMFKLIGACPCITRTTIMHSLMLSHLIELLLQFLLMSSLLLHLQLLLHLDLLLLLL